KVYSEIIQTWFGGSKDAAEIVLKGRFVPLGILDSPLAGISPFNDIRQNTSLYPHPNNGTFSLTCEISRYCDIEVSIYEMRGKAVFTQYFNGMHPGEQVLHLSTALQPGVYLLELSSGEYRKVMPLTIIR
ncbi:MAG TPA: T9SS type A sorting domain-containing protein, partial [Candidatus Kapabacteria bacterium]|nr:T9SS type A sorting domain-containing protein [Candidatus Kapabacteria bacterium]